MSELTQITETVFINPGILNNEQNNTWLPVDMEFFFWHSKLVKVISHLFATLTRQISS